MAENSFRRICYAISFIVRQTNTSGERSLHLFAQRKFGVYIVNQQFSVYEFNIQFLYHSRNTYWIFGGEIKVFRIHQM